MWPFIRKKSAADMAIEEMPKAIEAARKKWLIYNELPFKMGVPLDWKIRRFMIPFEQFLRGWDAYKDAPGAVVLLIVCKGVQRSGTHTKAEIEAALNITLPSGHDR